MTVARFDRELMVVLTLCPLLCMAGVLDGNEFDAALQQIVKSPERVILPEDVSFELKSAQLDLVHGNLTGTLSLSPTTVLQHSAAFTNTHSRCFYWSVDLSQGPRQPLGPSPNAFRRTLSRSTG